VRAAFVCRLTFVAGEAVAQHLEDREDLKHGGGGPYKVEGEASESISTTTSIVFTARQRGPDAVHSEAVCYSTSGAGRCIEAVG
jgi:hypothetical protein